MTLDEFKNQYGDLGDANIESVTFLYESKQIRGYDAKIAINCKNYLRDYEYETIEIHFSDVRKFVFREGKSTNALVFEADYHLTEDGLITFDFSAERGWQNGEKKGESYLYLACKDFTWKTLSNDRATL